MKPYLSNNTEFLAQIKQRIGAGRCWNLNPAPLVPKPQQERRRVYLVTTVSCRRFAVMDASSTAARRQFERSKFPALGNPWTRSGPSWVERTVFRRPDPLKIGNVMLAGAVRAVHQDAPEDALLDVIELPELLNLLSEAEFMERLSNLLEMVEPLPEEQRDDEVAQTLKGLLKQEFNHEFARLVKDHIVHGAAGFEERVMEMLDARRRALMSPILRRWRENASLQAEIEALMKEDAA